MITKAYVVTEEQVAFLEELSAREDRSVSWIVRRIIEDEMKRRETDESKQAQES